MFRNIRPSIFIILIFFTSPGARALDACTEAFAVRSSQEVFLNSQHTKLLGSLIKDFRKSQLLTDEAQTHELYQFASDQLKRFGFKITATKVEISPEQSKTLIEILESPQNLIVGKLLEKIKIRFGARFLIDPLLYNSRKGRGYFSSDDNFIVLDLRELRGDLNTPSATLLHEIRHMYLRSLLGKKESVFHGDIMAAKGRALETRGFYDDWMSLEELTTYYKDVKTAQTKYSNGEIQKAELVREAKYLMRIASMTERQLNQVDLSKNSSNWSFQRADDRRSYTVAYQVMSSDVDPQKQSTVFMDFPIPENEEITDFDAFENLKLRYKKLELETARARRLAESVLNKFGG